ncbi:hypothetical protein Salat_0192100 [Sesamum alatum]|uniref:Uncharacterized protein n=1 Tax=Sesamum alatum TaxID=300844 RepID=A0AAE2CXS9_9LAMI|nr:hypothetical protein Salat_0192100 [Sesamum alatum]
MSLAGGRTNAQCLREGAIGDAEARSKAPGPSAIYVRGRVEGNWGRFQMGIGCQSTSVSPEAAFAFPEGLKSTRFVIRAKTKKNAGSENAKREEQRFPTAFIGYVLPWGQMSFWGATSINRQSHINPTKDGFFGNKVSRIKDDGIQGLLRRLGSPVTLLVGAPDPYERRNALTMHQETDRVKTVHSYDPWVESVGVLPKPSPDLLGWVAGLAPLVASVPETDALRYPARNLVSPTPLLVVPLPIAAHVPCEEVLHSLQSGLGGAGYRALTRLDHHRSKHYARVGTVYTKSLYPRGSLELWLGRGRFLNPYLRGLILDLLRSEIKPKEKTWGVVRL